MAGSNCKRSCTVDGCDKPYRARGYCATHWSRWRRHGSPHDGAATPLEGKCAVEWCDREARSRFRQTGVKYCAKHYLQMFNHGRILPKPADSDPSRICGVDGCKSVVRSPRAQLCEMHYMRKRRTGSTGPASRVHGGHESCTYCGAATGGKKYCSSRCATRSLRGNPIERECSVCDATYRPMNKGIDRKVCSDECKQTLLAAYQDVRRFNSSLTPEGRRLRHKVFSRDGWVCQLCGDPVNRKARWPSPDSVTIDHIIPVSKGGTHDERNLQCAHARCNVRKGAKMQEAA